MTTPTSAPNQSPKQPYFDQISDRYDRAVSTWESVYRCAREIIAPWIRGASVLDVGSGGIWVFDPAAAKEVTLLDISPKMLERIPLPLPHVRKVVGDARNLDGIAGASQDVILYLLCVHHVVGRSRAEAFRMLDEVLVAAKAKCRPGGRIVIVEPTLTPWLYALESLLYPLTRAVLGLKKVPMIFFYSPRILKSQIERCFGAEANVYPLEVKGWVDPLGGSFPGRIRIPAWVCPTRYFLFECRLPSR